MATRTRSFLPGGVDLLSMTFLCITVACFAISCRSTCDTVTSPNAARFRDIVPSKSMQDSLQAGKIVIGMPHFVSSEIFAVCGLPEQQQVPCVGSRQRVEDTEGWGRKYSCPTPKIFLDEYTTNQGDIAIWYQYPDFYHMDVSANDTLVLFNRVVSGDETFSSLVEYILNPSTIRLKEKVPENFQKDTLYGEIHYVETPRYRTGSSYWYLLELLSDEQTVTLKVPNYEFYPIEQIELNGEPVPSFRWRSVQ